VKDLCITTAVNEGYQNYIPWFIYFVCESYPMYSVRIFLSSKLGLRLKSALRLISGDFKVYENSFSGFPTDAHSIKCLRWLNYVLEFEDFKYLYICDLDMLICREEPTLLEQHINHCKVLGLPYSNINRPNVSPPRIGGYHFVEREPWFEAMLPVIKKYRKRLKSGDLTQAKVGKNESLLYIMIKESGLGLPLEYNTNSSPEYHFRPEHGFHVNFWNKSCFQHPSLLHEAGSKIQRQWTTFLRTDPNHMVYYQQFKKMQSSLVFRQLLELVSPKDIRFSVDRAFKNIPSFYSVLEEDPSLLDFWIRSEGN